jgi:general secretion pathway protein F
MINISDFVREYGLVLLVLLVILVTAFQLLMRKEVFRRNVHRMLLLAPFISGVVRGINTAQFSRTLGTLMESGVPVLDSMQIASQVMSNLIMRESVMTAARKVREGVTLKNALDADGYFPPMMLHLIGSGESSGKLDEMLHRAADTQDRELETMRATLLGMFEPLLILVMGGLVLMIVLAVLLPIFDLNTLVQ